MEDSEHWFQSKCDKEQLKEKAQLKVAVWALCKESNIASGEGQNILDSVCASPPGKRLKSDELKKENGSRGLQKFFASPCSVEGLERKPILCCEDQDLKATAEAERDPRDNLVGLVIPRIENVDAGLKEEVEFGGGERREEKVKEKVEFWEVRKEGKCFKFEDSKNHGDESQATDIEMTQVKETARAMENIHAMENEDSQSQVKAEYEEGSYAKDSEMKHDARATEDVEKMQEKVEYKEDSRREQIGEESSASEAKIVRTLAKIQQKQKLEGSYQAGTQKRILLQLSTRAFEQFVKWKGSWGQGRAFVESKTDAWVSNRGFDEQRFLIRGADEMSVQKVINMIVTQSLTAVASPHDYSIEIPRKRKKKKRKTSVNTRHPLNSDDNDETPAEPKCSGDGSGAGASHDKDAGGNPMWDMGNMKKVVVRNFMGKTSIDFREFYFDKNTKEFKPGKKGISLTHLQYKKLKSVIEDIDHALPLSFRLKNLKHFK